MPEMPAPKRGSDPSGNRQYADRPIWCYVCKQIVVYVRKERLSAAAHEHIDRFHTPRETPNVREPSAVRRRR